MQVTSQKKQLSALIAAHKKTNQVIGFIPTMGALHAGHLSLIKNAYTQSDVVVVSIFVNPTQFDNATDLKKYPRALDKDLELLKKHYPKVIVFSPSAEEVYNGAIFSKTFDFGSLENYMEGKHRTGHFDGVGTVLNLLFEIVQPEKAFFGEKDFQQLLIVKKLVSITGQHVEIIGCPIAREPSGLARSSRNERLTETQRTAAASIYKILQKAKEYFGIESVDFITHWVQDQFKKNMNLSLEYFEIADAKTLKPFDKKDNSSSYRAFISAYAGEIRLIDNIALN